LCLQRQLPHFHWVHRALKTPKARGRFCGMFGFAEKW
jgi:hypothetical protein